MRRGFGEGHLRKRDYLENVGVDGRILLKWTFKKWNVGMDRIYLLRTVTGGELL
jgi:hypothetical protein